MSRAAQSFAFLVLGVCLSVAVGGFVAAWLYVPSTPSPLVRYAPCPRVPSLGPNVLVCKGNLHAYHLQAGGPADMGRVTPLPWTPAR